MSYRFPLGCQHYCNVLNTSINVLLDNIINPSTSRLSHMSTTPTTGQDVIWRHECDSWLKVRNRNNLKKSQVSDQARKQNS